MSRVKKKKSHSTDDTFTGTYTRPEISIHINTPAPKIDDLVTDDRRSAPRFKFDNEVVIFFSGISFRTKILNISTGGLLLSESIPAKFVNHELEMMIVRVINGVRDVFVLKGKALGAPLRTARIQFSVLSDTQLKKLESILKGLEQIK